MKNLHCFLNCHILPQKMLVKGIATVPCSIAAKVTPSLTMSLGSKLQYDMWQISLSLSPQTLVSKFINNWSQVLLRCSFCCCWFFKKNYSITNIYFLLMWQICSPINPTTLLCELLKQLKSGTAFFLCLHQY